MKNIIKLCSVICLVMCFTACDDNDDLGFRPTENVGWIQFVEGSPSTIISNQADQEILRVGVDIQVPRTDEDLTINYNLVSISGLDPNGVFSNSGSIVSPAGQTSYMGPDNGTGINYVFLPTIDFDISEIGMNLTEPMIFDIVLASTSSSVITVGLGSEGFPASQRIAICPSLDASGGLLLGDYTLTIPTGDGPFGAQFEDSLVVTITEGDNGPFSRTFSADYLPGITLGFPVVDIPFQLDNGVVTIPDGITTGLACGGVPVFIGGDQTNLSELPCGDAVITLNMIDFQGGACGQMDVPFTIMLTKI
ncbi:hypothetical protein [Psychroserpens sp. MEBiC05023]